MNTQYSTRIVEIDNLICTRVLRRSSVTTDAMNSSARDHNIFISFNESLSTQLKFQSISDAQLRLYSVATVLCTKTKIFFTSTWPKSLKIRSKTKITLSNLIYQEPYKSWDTIDKSTEETILLFARWSHITSMSNSTELDFSTWTSSKTRQSISITNKQSKWG